MAGISLMRSDGSDVQAALIRVTVRETQYEIDLNSLDYNEKRLAKQLLSESSRSLATELIAGDDEAPYVIAFLAVRRVQPKVDFEADIAPLTPYTLNVEIVVDEDDPAPLADGSSTPSSPEAPAAPAAKASSRKGSTKAA